MTIFIITTIAAIAVICLASGEASNWPAWKKVALGVMLLVAAQALLFATNSDTVLAMYAPYASRSANADVIVAYQLVADAIILGFLWLIFGWLYHLTRSRKDEREETGEPTHKS